MTIGTILTGCKIPIKKEGVPQHLLTLINYFDSNRIKEFDTVSFDKSRNLWQVTDTDKICYTYEIGFPNRVSGNYQFPVSDSLERIWVSDKKAFVQAFPLKKNLPDQIMDIILNKNGLIDIKTSWMNNNFDESNDVLFSSVEPKSLFKSKNPFEYFKYQNKTMDSLEVKSIGKNPFGNVITISLKEENEFLDYLPNNLLIKSSYRHVFDSVIQKGKKINQNWVQRKFKES